MYFDIAAHKRNHIYMSQIHHEHKIAQVLFQIHHIILISQTNLWLKAKKHMPSMHQIPRYAYGRRADHCARRVHQVSTPEVFIRRHFHRFESPCWALT